MPVAMLAIAASVSAQVVFDSVTRAKAATGDPDVRKSWILFGDPSMKLK